MHPKVAEANRDFLRGLYSAIKDYDAHVRFTFVTGVSKFSKVSLFSGLNNLADLTMDPRYSAICGYTDADLDAVFAPELPGLHRDEIRDWYNGYSWRGDQKVYNPFDILLLFDSREYKAHWFETGSPSFLIETLFQRRLGAPALEDMIGTDDLLSKFDVDDMAAEALLFQTGYLTILEERNLGGKTLYRLGYPNREVKQSLNEHLLRAMGPDASRQGQHDIRLYELLSANDFAGLETLFRSFFAGIPYEWHTKQRHRELRRLLRQRVLFLVRRSRTRRHGGGQQQPRPARHGREIQRQRLPLRVQGGGTGTQGRGHGATERERIRRQVPALEPAHTPGCRGVQQGGAQSGVVGGGAGVKGVLGEMFAP